MGIIPPSLLQLPTVGYLFLFCLEHDIDVDYAEKKERNLPWLMKVTAGVTKYALMLLGPNHRVI